ncbi:MAG: hypothetical protein KGZ65_02565 [Sphingomonadales bacterium]|nr:hypothetical protein [Sphingomonadaceae bacterium]MBS3930088.1 hypothetical protein [Sphingomonadales bacterium]
MKVLCVCERGNSRSVCMTWLLKDHYGVEALACGITAITADTWRLLYSWADKVILMHAPLRRHIPGGDPELKMVVCDVGADVYWEPPHADLTDQCRSFIESRLGLARGRFLGGKAPCGRTS